MSQNKKLIHRPIYRTLFSNNNTHQVVHDLLQSEWYYHFIDALRCC